MKKYSILPGIFLLLIGAAAQETVEVSDLIIQQTGNNMIRVTIKIYNSSSREISEVAGYLDLYDNSHRITEKKRVQVQMIHDVPLRPGESKSRSVVMTQRPNMSGNAQYRITHLRFFGEQNIYMVCPNCGEIILKDN
ncbi:MAG TPA: hypothetical protein ENN20_06490 [Candidatus Marinimicrobia bacterium]|nr:hypothetical protein [Candidatus Neomarinimicrobiota bacterium]